MSVGKLCPFLSMATMKPAVQSSLVVAGGGVAPAQPAGSAMGCQGNACALYVEMRDEKGQIAGGNCSLTLLPRSIQDVSNSLAILCQVAMGKFDSKEVKNA